MLGEKESTDKVVENVRKWEKKVSVNGGSASVN